MLPILFVCGFDEHPDPFARVGRILVERPLLGTAVKARRAPYEPARCRTAKAQNEVALPVTPEIARSSASTGRWPTTIPETRSPASKANFAQNDEIAIVGGKTERRLRRRMTGRPSASNYRSDNDAPCKLTDVRRAKILRRPTAVNNPPGRPAPRGLA